MPCPQQGNHVFIQSKGTVALLASAVNVLLPSASHALAAHHKDGSTAGRCHSLQHVGSRPPGTAGQAEAAFQLQHFVRWPLSK